MLSRAARLAPSAVPLLRAAAQPSVVRSRIISAQRTYAKVGKPQPPKFDNSADKPSSTPKTNPETPSSAPEPKDATPEAPVEGEQEPKQPAQPLPDLTQGIPSTLAYEMAGKSGKHALAAISAEDAEFGGGRGGKGELPDSAYVSSSERKRQRLANRMFLAFFALGAGSIVYLGRNWDDVIETERHPEQPNGWGLGLWWDRASTRLSEFMNYYQEPAFEKLLPDVDPSFERPYTLCISLEDMLVHSEWSREHGWRVAKRPGVDYFLRYLSQYYELVLFTSVPFAIGEPLVRKLDPFRFIMWPLYREGTKYKDGQIVKDLSYLNRDLSKVIIIDTKAEHVQNQPENAIILDKWTGNTQDKDLVGLIPFLEYIHTMQYGDVRKVLKSFDGKHIPTEFARREALARAEFEKQLDASGKRKKPSGVSMLGGLLGLKPSNMSLMQSPDGEMTPQEAFAQGKMLQDIARERGQRNYEALEKEIRENGEKWLKEEAAMQEKAQQEALNSMMGSFSGWFVPSKPAKGADAAQPSSGEKKA
ncbi:phosphatase PSR1 [Plectosphaerella cucumerina]|uniref:Mitochondrial import inner membrane translocase subunit TIM50 n=1 Tax=Plectosphaerella cucumerina TaxID=40658 RepID=A0A8K0THV0_9PEZI|nr:phosphatase PSR1 [Plectosphaerella cucumerina]